MSDTDLPLVAEVSDRSIGLAWAKIDESEQSVVHLYQMWVATNFRRRGAGRMLLHAAIAWAKTSNAEAMALAVSCGDTAASRLYARAGFTPVGSPEPLRAGSPMLAQPMKLALNTQAAWPPRRRV
jgi:ribosomal protein S18 acetylase RimI-like enzyme